MFLAAQPSVENQHTIGRKIWLIFGNFFNKTYAFGEIFQEKNCQKKPKKIPEYMTVLGDVSSYMLLSLTQNDAGNLTSLITGSSWTCVPSYVPFINRHRISGSKLSRYLDWLLPSLTGIYTLIGRLCGCHDNAETCQTDVPFLSEPGQVHVQASLDTPNPYL